VFVKQNAQIGHTMQAMNAKIVSAIGQTPNVATRQVGNVSVNLDMRGRFVTV
jgi:hypothetical protein